ncbi:hypothetical protein [Rickettsia sp. TH2014]|uniref:hypothetical protein n=1 Tax=Rickettsia sp. TH2014 TaxID=1967503 RepID=UPI001C48E56D|nr:hypothetical protein [Rickettsia sp. TH2014]
MTLHTLFLDGNLNYNAIKEALENGFNVNQQDQDGDTPLHLLMSRYDHEPIIDVCVLLLEKGANINISNIAIILYYSLNHIDNWSENVLAEIIW